MVCFEQGQRLFEQQDERGIHNILTGCAPMDESRSIRIDGSHALGQRFDKWYSWSPGAQSLARQLCSVEEIRGCGLPNGIGSLAWNNIEARFYAGQRDLESKHRCEDGPV